MEWAALAVGVHQLDEIYFSDRREEAACGRWLAVPANCEALRPSFKRDPVSYLLALCDTLQDFGRIQGSTTTRALDVDRTESRVRYPCRAVELSLTLPGKRARAVFELGPDDGTCFGATEHDFEHIRAHKERQARMLFGEDGWFDHGDLFTHLDVAVRWGSRLSGELSRPRPASRPAGGHDVFISYHSTDRVEVREIVARLRAEGLSVWFDEVDILPGTPWMPAIEAQLDTVAAAAVFFGASGKGTWQEEEVWALLPRLKKRGCPIIPVIMASCQGEPEISPFLGSRSAVDFRRSDPDPLHWLVRGIRGTP
jgi:nucleotide-binding universal stress UspA family protein